MTKEEIQDMYKQANIKILTSNTPLPQKVGALKVLADIQEKVNELENSGGAYEGVTQELVTQVMDSLDPSTLEKMQQLAVFLLEEKMESL